ncbi:hypothetical protein SASPL_130548 [Salvia splendens]|uniref:VQ domain-containing protein n=1 Tax=Salvia splendens TaxID=180675 RepID=A0A8X8X5X0_SALSN|nr:protein HAIKU1-like [Salvia splendens]KAG6407556.1 hypothetical protein SASPL_130548 [Salvia splendens]
MDPNQPPTNRQMDHLGVNKMGKNIKKSPLHQPNFAGAAGRQQPQPQVYNINKNDFRDIVQQLTGSPLRDQPPRPPQTHPRPPNNRLQRVRPPPLASTGRPQLPTNPHVPIRMPAPGPMPYPNNLGRPPPPVQYDQHSPNMLLPSPPPDVWGNTAESPISAYMRYLQNSIIDSGPRQPHPFPQGHMQHQVPAQNLPHPHAFPNPAMPPRGNGPPTNFPSPRFNGPPPLLPSPRANGPPPLIASPRMKGPMPPLPSPRENGPPPLVPSPTSQFLLPSPTGFMNLLSPRSPYPLLSPGFDYPPISPNFSFGSMGQSGVLGPGPHPPPSPGYGFPLPPSGFFPVPSPRWRNQ